MDWAVIFYKNATEPDFDPSGTRLGLEYQLLMPTILWVIVILLLLGALPVYPYSSSWGYYPSGGLGLLLVILLVVALVRR